MQSSGSSKHQRSKVWSRLHGSVRTAIFGGRRKKQSSPRQWEVMHNKPEKTHCCDTIHFTWRGVITAHSWNRTSSLRFFVPALYHLSYWEAFSPSLFNPKPLKWWHCDDIPCKVTKQEEYRRGRVFEESYTELSAPRFEPRTSRSVDFSFTCWATEPYWLYTSHHRIISCIW